MAETEISVTISVVSHLQGGLVGLLLEDIERHCASGSVGVVVTVNVEETLPFAGRDFSFPIKIIHNPRPKGFSVNHNAAFRASQGEYFCVTNPDIRLKSDPFPSLLGGLRDKRFGLAAPLVVDKDGQVENSARRFPTPVAPLAKALGIGRRLDYAIGSEPFSPDWVAGMFMLLPHAVFAGLGGFDERYFLYYEDVDLCSRLRSAGYDIVLDPSVTIVHDARRESHHNPAYLKWHLTSMVRFFSSPAFFSGLRYRLMGKGS